MDVNIGKHASVKNKKQGKKMVAIQKLKHFYAEKTNKESSSDNIDQTAKLRIITPGLAQKTVIIDKDSSDYKLQSLLKKRPTTNTTKYRAKVVMLIVSEGNDIRAKKEADVLLGNGYEVVFIGRKNGLTSVEEDIDGKHRILRVPTITDSETLRFVIGKNSSYFSLKEKMLAMLLAFIFQITNFSIISRASVTPRHIFKAKSFETAAAASRAKAVKKRSIPLFVKFLFLKALSITTKKLYSPWLLPVAAILAIITFPFNMLDKAVEALDRRAANSWTALMQPRGAIGIFRSLTNISIAKLAGIFKFVLSTLPRKFAAGIMAAIAWPFIKIRNRTIGYLAPRTRLVYTLFSYFFFYLETKAEIIKQNPDIVHSHDLYMLQAAVKAAKETKAKVIYDAHELETDRHSGIHPRVKHNIKNQEIKYGQQADGVITISEGALKIMQNHLKRDDIVIVYNSPVMSALGTSSDDNIRSELNLPKDIPLATFVGKLHSIHAHDHRINNIIEALAYIPEMHLVILGAKSANAVAEITVWAERYFVSGRVHLVDPVPYEHLINYITTADLGVNPMQNKCMNTDYSMPNKVFEMSLAGIPIAQSNLKDSVRYLSHFNMGIPMDAMDAKDIARAMMDVYSGRKHMKKSSQDLQSMRDEFGWRAQGKKLLSLYERVQRR